MPLSGRKVKPMFSATRLMAVVLLVVVRIFSGSTLWTLKVLYSSLVRAFRPRSSAMMRNARTSGTPAESSVPRPRQNSASSGVFSGR